MYCLELGGTWTTAVPGVNGVTVTTTPISGTRNQVTVTIPMSNPKVFTRIQIAVP